MPCWRRVAASGVYLSFPLRGDVKAGSYFLAYYFLSKHLLKMDCNFAK